MSKRKPSAQLTIAFTPEPKKAVAGKPSVWTIYCHMCRENSKRYIGLTKHSMQKRWEDHVRDARKGKGRCAHFHAAIAAHGADAFDHIELERCATIADANAAETRWIAFFESTDSERGYNLSDGGGAINTHPETRAKISAANKKWQSTLTPETRTALAKERWEAMSPDNRAKVIAAAHAVAHARTTDQYVAAGLIGQARMTPEARSERVRKQWVGVAPEDRSARLRKSYAGMSPEKRLAKAKKTADAQRGKPKKHTQTFEEHSAAMSANWGKKTPGERSDFMKRMWVKRRANQASQPPPRALSLMRVNLIDPAERERSLIVTKAWVTRRANAAKRLAEAAAKKDAA